MSESKRQRHDDSQDRSNGDWVQRERDSGPPTKPIQKLIDKRELLARVPLSYPSIWKRMRRGEFPQPFRLGGKNAWDESEIDAYLQSLPRRTYPAGSPVTPKAREDAE
jgi:predicted DNA-binding transcriptional regulator AlpA